MLTKQQLQLINRQTLKYPLDIAEKDYYLARAIKLISESALGKVLVFKGGTAIHHCYLPQYRFSEDLDFTSLDHQLGMESVVEVLESSGEFVVKKKYESPATVKIERLSYKGVLGQPGAIKVEIDRKQNVVLAPASQVYKNQWNVDAVVNTMNIQEIAAEKLRAAATRARYRDFYDLYLIWQQFSLDTDQVVELLKQKEIRQPISVEQIHRNWLQAQQEVTSELDAIHFSLGVSNETITKLLNQLQFTPIIHQKP